ncbi:hypothetical protein ABZ281_49160, partial [Streptomyces sp. NPDC006265]
MTSQAADRPEPVGVTRRSKITPEREQEFYDAVLEQLRECGYDSVTMEGKQQGAPGDPVGAVPGPPEPPPL